MRLILSACLLSLLLGMALSCVRAAAPPAPPPQYIFLNRAPGQEWDQNRPETVTDSLFTAPVQAVNVAGSRRRLGLSFILSYLDGPPHALEDTLRRLLALAQAHDMPVLIVLDGQNWWGYRSDLWDWWDPSLAGYDLKNRANVEWTDWSPQSAVKICWRNWGHQVRVLPAPNLESPKFREASRQEMSRLAGIIAQWRDQLPPRQRDLFPGVKVGWEASIGVNAFYYPGGNSYLEQFPTDPSHDPRTGLDMSRDFAGGLVPLGYAALTSRGWVHPGPVTLSDQERVTADYLAFVSHVCRQSGLRRDEVWTHAGGQYSPWPLHYSHQVAVNPDLRPGWSLYGVSPDQAGDLGETLTRAKSDVWCAAEWLPSATTATDWEKAYQATLSFRQCRYLSVYNWEGIRANPNAIEGLRRALMDAPP